MQLLMNRKGKLFRIKDKNKDIHTQYGLIRSYDIRNAKVGDKITTNTGNEMVLIESNIRDRFNWVKKGPQKIITKDIGLIIADTGVGKDSIVVDAGTGSGMLAISLANICREVISYERRKEFAEIAKENIRSLKVDNLKIKVKDINEGIDESGIDLITLDMAEPERVLENGYRSLKAGGFLVAYIPNMNQVIAFVKRARENFLIIGIKELIERDWIVDDRRARPEHNMLGHTAFLVFCRKF